MTNVATIAKKKDAALAMPNWADEIAALAAEGLEDVRPEDFSLPFFRLLQSLSPETKKSDGAYVPGAGEGMWLDTVAREVYDAIIFVPSRFATHYIEWRTREDGGGLVANHGTDRSVLDRCKRDENTGRDMTPEGTEIVATGTWYGIVVSGEINGETVPLNKEAVIAFAGTQQKVSRKWVSDAASIKLQGKDGRFFTPPLYAMAYKLYSTPAKNDRGSWALAAFQRAGWTFDMPHGQALFAQARAFSDVSKNMQPSAMSENLAVTPVSANDSEIPF